MLLVCLTENLISMKNDKKMIHVFFLCGCTFYTESLTPPHVLIIKFSQNSLRLYKFVEKLSKKFCLPSKVSP